MKVNKEHDWTANITAAVIFVKEKKEGWGKWNSEEQSCAATPLSVQWAHWKNHNLICLCVCLHSVSLDLGIIQSLLRVIVLTCAWVRARAAAISLAAIMCLDEIPWKPKQSADLVFSVDVKNQRTLDNISSNYCQVCVYASWGDRSRRVGSWWGIVSTVLATPTG